MRKFIVAIFLFSCTSDEKRITDKMVNNSTFVGFYDLVDLKKARSEYLSPTRVSINDVIINRKGHVLASRILGKEKEQLTKLEISVLNLFDNMPKWNPGKCNGVAVNCLYQTIIRI